MTVIIPAYEPDERLTRLVGEIHALTGYRVVVVDDGSSPGCRTVFDALLPGAHVLRHCKNLGKGRAIKTALAFVAKTFPEETGVVIADADGQHAARDIRAVAEAWLAAPRGMVIGQRCFDRGVPFKSRAGNLITRAVFAFLSGVRVHDTQTGLRAFGTVRIPFLLSLPGERYEYEMNVLLAVAERREALKEVCIQTIYEGGKNETSHFHPLRDSLMIYGCILRFAGSSAVSFLADYLAFLLLVRLFIAANVADALILGNIAARVFSATVNYIINRKFVFRSRDSVGKSAARYYALAAVILAADTLLLHAAAQRLGIPYGWAKLAVEAVLFAVSLFVQRFFVFKKSRLA